MARMAPGSTTDDYRKAVGGGDDEWGLGYQWTDKPHRLVYDLCGEVDRLRAALQSVLDMETNRYACASERNKTFADARAVLTSASQ